MPEFLFRKAKYKLWEESHNFDNCRLNRKEYGEFLISYITGEQDGFVLNLNGAWGSGKTEFLKRLYTGLLVKKHPCIYIDAWESDFSKDPLTVVTSELLNQLKAFNDEINGNQASIDLSKLFTKVIKGAAVGLSGTLTKYALGDGTIGSSAMQEWLDDDSLDYMDFLTKEHSEQVEAIKMIRENLTSLANVLESSYSVNLPIVVLVDELDRCRPTYAIEMLEVIKHFFKTDKFVFVVATDSDQLSHSINAVYGSKFDSKQYLKRFFDRKATLPEPNIEDYLNAHEVDNDKYSTLNLFPKMVSCNQIQSINKTISLLAKAYDLHIRDIDQLISKFESCLRLALTTRQTTNKAQYINFPALLIGLIEYDKSQEIYKQRTKNYAPDPVIENDKFKISSDFNLFDFVKKSMDNITFFEVTEERYRMGTYPTFRLLTASQLRAGSEHAVTEEYNSFITETINNINYAQELHQQNNKYWNWDDMKIAIELAGTLE